ncbi:uncharacterized protein LOC124264251 [Haliotis rubra]|uniref:uncharacterized protein LOC124264251 n=1 Tax=Haliotis rubra TaxID=36100 RepID=UPI001EE53041|nr:uncharacterized protein LOC124264251 [Haliotis rubra]
MKLRPTASIMLRRVFAISDLHVDHRENMEIVQQWSPLDYENDALIVAGDVTDSLPLLQQTLQHLQQVFFRVYYVPGNHELWIRKPELEKDSITKFHQIVTLCNELGIGTKPELLCVSHMAAVWIVPLFSWYSTPQEDPEDSLYVAPQNPVGEDKSDHMWMDNHMCVWPSSKETRSKYFADLNSQTCSKQYADPVISFSHFLPRTDLIKPSDTELAEIETDRKRLGLESAVEAHKKGHINPRSFNFTRFAGCKVLEAQIRQIGSSVHVFGHQHRNKDRTVDGVRYVSHCLGYKRERVAGLVSGIDDCTPKQIWPSIV